MSNFSADKVFFPFVSSLDQAFFAFSFSYPISKQTHLSIFGILGRNWIFDTLEFLTLSKFQTLLNLKHSRIQITFEIQNPLKFKTLSNIKPSQI